MPIYKKVNKNFFKKWDYNMSYILGFFAADGYITINKRGGQFWCIQIIDRTFLEEIKNTIESNHKINIRIDKLTKNKIYRLQIGSIEMCDDLKKLGFEKNKTKRMLVPNIPKKYFSEFVRGYFDGDGNIWSGYIHKNGKNKKKTLQIMFTSCSLDFLKQLHVKLKEVGIQGGSIYNHKDKYARLSFSLMDSLKICNFMYNGRVDIQSNLFLQRKKKIFEEFKHLRA